jgi:hypothetical protein
MCIDKKSTRTQDQDYLGPNRVATIIYRPVRVLDTHGLPGLLCAKKHAWQSELAQRFMGLGGPTENKQAYTTSAGKKKNVC